MSHRNRSHRRSWKEQALCLLLSAALLIGIAPAAVPPASAHWADEYLSQLVDWGIMRADQASDPDAAVTRAEFASIINRAYGYTETGPIPFTDVQPTDWFYDDISIAYTAGYMAGTSNSTADPNGFLTREMATCILARNMMMKESSAESLAFTDSREISNWARGLVKTAVDNYVLSGYPDNSFGPRNNVSKGEMAVLVTRCVGNPVNRPGEYTLGDVFNNVTITSPNVTLRDTAISGDLYISGGVGLGGVKLENVRVLGRIIVSGTGESEMGDASVVMRNVTAAEMLVDNMRDKTVTLRADGLTNIGKTVVRTNAYLEDNTPDENGLREIALEGTGTQLDLAGRIKEVVSKAPLGNIQLAKGTVEKLTVDEASTNATIQIDRNTEVKELDLDVASNVTGDGDVKQMTINAPGVTSSVFPEKLYIRPGLTGNVGGDTLDSAGAEEYSRDPKILSGYPIAGDVAPTSFRADFATNKKGTVYWAVSNITDGSLSSEDLVSPPSYGTVAVKNGSISVPSADTVVNTQVTGLTVAGSYYLSAVMQDARGVRSPVKVISFTTPDNTKPAFAQGYPSISLVTDTLAQAVVMPTKSCKLYYAVLPQGASAPTTSELRSASVTGNKGYGVLDVTKNTESTFTASNQLEELKDYVLYLWLCDADGANSSNIQSLRFKTVDSTPPRYSPEASIASVGQTNVNLTVGLDEPGTVYWVVVPRGKAYPLPNNQNPNDNVQDAAGVSTADLAKEYAKLQVKNGRNATRSGSVRIATANADTAMNITGLTRETAYDLYYIGQDSAGNFASEVKKIAINTLDNTPPTVKQYFNRYTGRDNTRDPLVTTDIMLEFSEDIRSSKGAGGGKGLLDLYASVGSNNTAEAAQARRDLTSFLEDSIALYQHSAGNRPEKVGKDKSKSSWVDFSKATVTSQDGKVIVTLPYDDNELNSAHRLGSGSTYHFEIGNITDNSDAQNAITPNPVNYENMGTTHNVPTFTTVFAQVHLTIPTLAADTPYIRDSSPDTNGVGASGNNKGTAVIDYTFRMIPDATQTVDKNNTYDLQLYSGAESLAFDMYCRIDTGNGYLTTANDAKNAGITPKTAPDDSGNADSHGWFYLGNSGAFGQQGGDTGLRGISVGGNPGMGALLNFPTVSTLNQDYTYDFIITVTEQGGGRERGVWTGTVDFEVHVLAGASNDLSNLANNANAKNRDQYTSRPLTEGGLVSIGQTQNSDKFLKLTKTFLDTRVPKFDAGSPKIEPGDSFADVEVVLDRAGTIYYVAAQLGTGGITTRVEEVVGSGTAPSYTTAQDLLRVLPTEGQNELRNDTLIENYGYYPNGTGGTLTQLKVVAPYAEQIRGQSAYASYPHGVVDYRGGGISQNIPLRGLKPQTDYVIYFVMKGVSDDLSPVFAYQFRTTESSRPRIALTDGMDGTVGIDTSYGTSNVYSVPSDLTWVVFTEREGLIALEDKVGKEVEIPGDSGVTGYRTMSVLNALMTSYDAITAFGGRIPADTQFGSDKNGYSIFDLFASEDQKRQLDSFVRNPGNTAGRISQVGNTSTTPDLLYTGTANWLATAQNKNPALTARFLILMVGHNSASSTGSADWSTVDSFRALDDIKVMDEGAPKLEETNKGVITGVTGSVSTDDGKTFRGVVSLTFDKDLYWERPNSTGTETLYNVMGGLINGAKIDDSTHQVSLQYESQCVPISALDGIVIQGSGRMFTISFNSATDPTIVLRFLTVGAITSQRGSPVDGTLEITFHSTTTGNSGMVTYTPYIDVKFGGQSARVTGTSYSDKIETSGSGAQSGMGNLQTIP